MKVISFRKAIALLLIAALSMSCAIATSSREGAQVKTEPKVDKSKIIDYQYVIRPLKKPQNGEPAFQIRVEKYPIYEITKFDRFEKIVKMDPVLGGLLIATPITAAVCYGIGFLMPNEEENNTSIPYSSSSKTQQNTPAAWAAAGAIIAMVLSLKAKKYEKKSGYIDKPGKTYASEPDTSYLPAIGQEVVATWTEGTETKNARFNTDSAGIARIDLVKDLGLRTYPAIGESFVIEFKTLDNKGMPLNLADKVNLSTWLVPYTLKTTAAKTLIYNQPSERGRQIASVGLGTALFILENKDAWVRVVSGDTTGWVRRDSGPILYTEPEYADPARPPALQTQAVFDDSGTTKPNRRLDGDEAANIRATVSNKNGKGSAYQVRLIIDSDNKEIIYPKETLVGTIEAGTSKSIDIPIRAPLRVHDSIATLKISTLEKNDNNAPLLPMNLDVRSIPLPKLEIGSTTINDGLAGQARGNGNGLPENGETVVLQAQVRNTGDGEALNIDASFDIEYSEIRLIHDQILIPRIPPHESVTASFVFAIPTTFKGDHLPATIILNEGRGAAKTEEKLPISIGYLAPSLGYKTQIIESRGNNDGKIQRGEWVELRIIPENKGTLDAEGVAIKVTNPASTIDVMGSSEAIVGNLARKSASVPVSFIFNVKRTTPPGTYSIPLRISQKDFPAFEDTIKIEIQPETAPPIPKTEPAVADNLLIEPGILIISPSDGLTTSEESVRVAVRAKDDQKVTKITVKINGREASDLTEALRSREVSQTWDFEFAAPLQQGKNVIEIIATDNSALNGSASLTVTRGAIESSTWIVSIGLNDYLNPSLPDLKYGVDDAVKVHEYFVNTLRIPQEKAFLVTGTEAENRTIRRILGTDLKNKVGPQDRVIIFYSGHGGIEEDKSNPDGDGFEKYLLPYDADPDDLFSTALPMRDMQRIFERIPARTLVFIADTCYSGAVGGKRTVKGLKISDGYTERLLAGAAGRVLLTATEASRMSEESDEFKHGVFTHFLLKGLEGEADSNKDGLISIEEISQFVKERVEKKTEGRQKPILQQSTPGLFYLGRAIK